MNAIKRRLGLVVGGLALLVGVWACQATRNSDGSIDLRFAPDMVITAWGLEDALSKLTDLLVACVGGTFPRPCTPEERADIRRTINKIVQRKDCMGDPPAPDGNTPT